MVFSDTKRSVVLQGNILDSNLWAAGMFLVFNSKVFKRLRGFDQRFFMYYEDVDICRRIHSLKLPIFYLEDVTVTHYAQRGSRKNLRLLRYHVVSLCLYHIKWIFGG